MISTTLVEGKLHKRHNILSYHKVRQAVADGFLMFHHLTGISNPADILSKHWACADVWHLLRPMLFTPLQGDDRNTMYYSESELKKYKVLEDQVDGEHVSNQVGD